MKTAQSAIAAAIDQVQHLPVDCRSGVVTNVVAVMAGEQSVGIDVVGAGTDDPRVVLRWGRIAMTFTSAEQLQRMLGLFGMARQAMVGVSERVSLPVVEQPVSEVSMLTSITWTHNPTGAASVERMYHMRLRRTVSYVALTVSPIVFHILDRDGLNSAIKALIRAHQLAITVYPGGQAYADDPNSPPWMRAHRRILRPRDGSWSHR